MDKPKRTSLILLGCFSVIGVAAMYFDQNGGAVGYPSCLVITPVTGQADADSLYGSGRFSGAIKNNCDEAFKNIRLTYKFYDGSGTVLGEGMALDDAGLDNGESYRFQVDLFFHQSWERYKLTKVETW